MLKRLISVVLFVALAVSVAMLINSFDKKKAYIDVTTSAPDVAKIVQHDLRGEWKTPPDAKVAFVATIDDKTISVDMPVQEGVVAFWRGSYTQPKLGENTFLSIGTNAEFYISSAPDKQFLIQDGGLSFSYEVMGVRSAVELRRA